MVDESEAPVLPIAKTRLARSRRQVYLQIVAATVILACGIVIGAGAALLRLKDDIAPGPMPPPVVIAGEMQRRYGLTDEQTEKVKVALKESSERMRKLFADFRPKMEAEFKQFSAAIKDTLSSEQFKQWERDFQSRRGRRPGRFGPGGPGPGGPGPGGHRSPGWRGGPGGGRGGPGRADPNGRPSEGRREYQGFGPMRPGPAEPNSPVER